ncbi:MAG: hypothetical protein WB763_12275, partial [Terriglobia bacterium]
DERRVTPEYDLGQLHKEMYIDRVRADANSRSAMRPPRRSVYGFRSAAGWTVSSLWTCFAPDVSRAIAPATALISSEGT